MSADLIAFLRGCLDEDERVAKARRNRVFSALLDHYGMDEGDDDQEVGSELTALAMGAAGWTLERDLAEVKAKRAILDAHPIATNAALYCPPTPHLTFGCKICHEYDNIIWGGGYCDTLLALTQIYASQPGWSEEWAVTE